MMISVNLRPGTKRGRRTLVRRQPGPAQGTRIRSQGITPSRRGPRVARRGRLPRLRS